MTQRSTKCGNRVSVKAGVALTDTSGGPETVETGGTTAIRNDCWRSAGQPVSHVLQAKKSVARRPFFERSDCAGRSILEQPGAKQRLLRNAGIEGVWLAIGIQCRAGVYCE